MCNIFYLLSRVSTLSPPVPPPSCFPPPPPHPHSGVSLSGPLHAFLLAPLPSSLHPFCPSITSALYQSLEPAYLPVPVSSSLPLLPWLPLDSPDLRRSPVLPSFPAFPFTPALPSSLSSSFPSLPPYPIPDVTSLLGHTFLSPSPFQMYIDYFFSSLYAILYEVFNFKLYYYLNVNYILIIVF